MTQHPHPNPSHAAASHAKPGLPIDLATLDRLLAEHRQARLPRYERLWSYYRNPMSPTTGQEASLRRYRLGQEQGLPPRLRWPGPEPDTAPREVVIENDIAWRLHTMVDFMFGQPVTFQSTVANPDRAALIDAFLSAVFEAAGGAAFLQDLALLGSVYGFVDVLLQVRGPAQRGPALRGADDPHLPHAARRFVLETIAAPRAVPLLDPDDYRRLVGYVVHFRQRLNRAASSPGLLGRLRRAWSTRDPQEQDDAAARFDTVQRTLQWTASGFAELIEDTRGRRVVARSANLLGVVPVIHIQNLPQPFFYEGLSEVEPLIPLQDELNTRLSDRANRVTLQSFKMYLGKGLEGFLERPIAPGQMWQTDNTQASIEAFGGDAASPSEDRHISELREALDKTSGVSPIAAGVLRDKVGNLTSENALRIVLMGLLAKTHKKRVAYGAGLRRLGELILHAADVFGLLHTTPQERRLHIAWPSAMPENESEKLQLARMKIDLGVPRRHVLAELGYAQEPDAEPEAPTD